MGSDLLRLVNLAEVLAETAASEGRDVEPLDDDVLLTLSEGQVREYFATGQLPASTAAVGTPSNGVAATAPPSKETFAKWFPGLERSGTSTPTPRLRVVCFPSSGNAEDMFTSEGTGIRRAPSPLLEWCRSHQAEVLAVQPPGRGNRLKEPPAASAQHMAQQVYEVLASRLADSSTPWVVISHSMGCWVAYQLLRRCREAGVPLPKAWFLSAMPAPDLPVHQRPWRRQATLDDKGFIDECRAWDINEAVFAAGMWEMYQPLLRADFTVFDSYDHDGGGEAAFPDLPIYSWWGAQDRRVTRDMVKGWSRFTTGPFQCKQAAGNHLWPLSKEHKAAWLQQIVDALTQLKL